MVRVPYVQAFMALQQDSLLCLGKQKSQENGKCEPEPDIINDPLG